MAKKPTKLYYSITEVGELLDLKPHILRYWETEFPILHPKKNRAGNRAYRRKDIDIARTVKHLLYDEGFTIDGARKKLNQLKEAGIDIRNYPKSAPQIEKRDPDEYIELLFELRRGLKDVLTLLDNNPGT